MKDIYFVFIIVALGMAAAIADYFWRRRRQYLSEIQKGTIGKIFCHSQDNEGWFYVFVTHRKDKIVAVRYNVEFTHEMDDLIAAGWMLPTLVSYRCLHETSDKDSEYFDENFLYESEEACIQHELDLA